MWEKIAANHFAATALPDAALRDDDGNPVSLGKLRGKWLIITVDSANCDGQCDKKLYLMRQVRISLSSEMNRVERVLLVRGPGNVSAALLKKYPGMHMLTGADANLLGRFPAITDPTDHVYLVDPLGNLMMRFPENADPKRVIKDMKLLLKASQIGSPY